MVTITDTWLQSAQLTEHEIRLELAVALLRARRISFEQAQQLVGLPTLEFLQLLRQHGVELHYDVADLQQDIATLKRLEANGTPREKTWAEKLADFHSFLETHAVHVPKIEFLTRDELNER